MAAWPPHTGVLLASRSMCTVSRITSWQYVPCLTQPVRCWQGFGAVTATSGIISDMLNLDLANQCGQPNTADTHATATLDVSYMGRIHRMQLL